MADAITAGGTPGGVGTEATWDMTPGALEQLEIERFGIKGPVLLTPSRKEDERGWTRISYSAARLADAIGRDVDFMQDTEVFSAASGTLRGFHFQHPPFGQGKLVRIINGAVRDVVIDIRDGSPTFGQHVVAEIDAKDGKVLWIPEGFAHGFVTTRVNTLVTFKVTAPYAPESQGRIVWNDPLLHVDWGVREPIVSDRDRRAPGFADLVSPFGTRGI